MVARGLLIAGWLLATLPALAAGPPPADRLLKQGEYLFHAADCHGCHTDDEHKGRPLAGGRALKTDFGVFYAPNITPDLETGIGQWSEVDFVRALREGISPAGKHLYPAFPYASYTKMTDADLHALWVYLRSRPAVKQANRPHELKWFARARTFVGGWKTLYFTPGAYRPDAGKPASWNRGAYLAEALAHCGECHTPRGALGGPKSDMHYAGTRDGPEDSVIPNITPDKQTGIGRWSRGDLVTYLGTGLMPDGDSAGDLMAEVIDNSLSRLTRDDLQALTEYLQSLPAIQHAVSKPKNKKKGEYD